MARRKRPTHPWRLLGPEPRSRVQNRQGSEAEVDARPGAGPATLEGACRDGIRPATEPVEPKWWRPRVPALCRAGARGTGARGAKENHPPVSWTGKRARHRVGAKQPQEIPRTRWRTPGLDVGMSNGAVSRAGSTRRRDPSEAVPARLPACQG